MRRVAVMLVSALAFAVFVAEVRGEQIVTTKLMLFKDPPGAPAARKILWKSQDDNADGDLSLLGDPRVSGATLHILMLPSVHCTVPPCDAGGGDQCFNLPAGGWSKTGPRGFRYDDPTLANGAVRSASVRQAASGRFSIKARLHGAGIDLFLEDEIGFYGLNFAIGGGEDYRTGSSGADASPNTPEMFRVKNEDGSTGYVTPCVAGN